MAGSASKHVAYLDTLARSGDPLINTTASLFRDQARQINKPLTDGWTLSECIMGRGFSSIEYWRRKLGNGRYVLRRASIPGPFDGAAGLSTDITEEWKVWVGWEEWVHGLDDGGVSPEGACQPQNGMDLPQGALRFVATNFDGDVNWYALFPDEESATRYAASLPALAEGEAVPPLNGATLLV